MIDELINLKTRNLLEGKDILAQVKSCREIKGSNSSIYEVELLNIDSFRESQDDIAFLNSIIDSNNQNEKPDLPLFILKEIVGISLKDEIKLVKVMKSFPTKIPGFIYMLSYAVYKTDALEVAYVLMERGDSNLQKYIESRAANGDHITCCEYTSIMWQTISTLAEMQAAKIAHNDIKPANILVMNRPKKKKEVPSLNKDISTYGNNSPQMASTTVIKEGESSPAILISEAFFHSQETQKPERDAIIVKLCDIGSGQTNANTEKTAEQRGTIQYMAPEILQQSKNRINIYKQDVFSLGLCFVFIVLRKTPNYHLTLRPPLKDLVSSDLALSIFKEVLQEWIHVIGSKMNNSEAIVKILSRMLSIEISERPDFIELKEICTELFSQEGNNLNHPMDTLHSSSQQNNIILQESGAPLPSLRLDTTENHKELQVIQKSPSRSTQNGDIYFSKPKSISLALVKKRAPQDMNLLNVPLSLQQDSFETKTSSEEDKSYQNSPTAQRIQQPSKPLVTSQFAQSPSVNKLSRQFDAVSSPHSNSNESKLPGSSVAQRRKYTQQQEKKATVHLGPPLAELAQSILLGPDFKQIVPQKSNSKGNTNNTAMNLSRPDPLISKPTATNTKDIASSAASSRAFIVSTPSQKFTESQGSSHQKNKIQFEQPSANASKSSLPSDNTISEPTSVLNLTKQKKNTTSQSVLLTGNNNSNLNTSIGFSGRQLNTKVSFHDNNTMLDYATTRKNNPTYSRKTPSSPQLKLPQIVSQPRPVASHYTSQFNFAQGEISRRDISELERSILNKDKNNSKLNLSPQVRTKSFQGVFDSEESTPPSPQQQSRNQNSGSPQMKSVQQKSTFCNKPKPNNHIKSIFGPLKQQTSVQVSKSVQHWNINDQALNTNSLPILDFSTSSMSSISKTLSKSSKSLTEGISERFESVFVSDYQEIQKFSEHFGMLGDKSQKYLTILFKGQDRNQHYGFAEILSRLFGIVHLTIIFSQQLKETIEWVFDCLSSISQSLTDLTIVFRDCNFSLTSNSNTKGSSSDFSRPSDNARNPISSSKLYLNLRLEGKILGASEMLESFAKKVISTEPRISTVFLANQSKSQEVVQGIALCLSALQKYTTLQNLSVELSQSLLNQQNTANLLSIIEPFNSLHHLSLNLSSNPMQLEKLFSPSFPQSLNTLFLNLSGVYLTSVELVKLTKALKSCSHLATLHLHLNSSFRKDQQNQLMLFLPDAMMLAKHTSIMADSNNLTDADFNTYSSDLLIPFEVETLVLSFSKNSLSLISFRILSQMIKCQQKLKKAIINFPLTILKSQVAQEFMNDSSTSYVVNTRISDYETITIQIEIKQQHMKLQQQRKSFKAHTKTEESPIKQMCSNFQKEYPIIEGSFCETCYEKYNCISGDSFFCSHCIDTCHQGHKIRQIFEFPSSSVLCSCKDIPECCLTYQQLENNHNISTENLSPLKLSVPV